MASVLESEEPGVTLISTFEDFGSKVECQHLYNSITRFIFPPPKESEWILEYKFSSDDSGISYAYLSRLQDNSTDTIDLSGTFSIISHDGFPHVLAIFLNHEFEKNTVKEIKLKKLDLILYEEELFCNGNLVLRCHLWQEPSQSRNTEYKVRYRSLIQECKIPWVIKFATFEDNINHFQKDFEIPMDFKDGKNNLSITFRLDFETFLREQTVPLYITMYKQNVFDLYICHSVFVQCINGTLVCLSKNKHYIHLKCMVATPFSLRISCEEFINNGQFYYPNGTLTLVCYLKCIKVLDVEFESISFENNTTSSEVVEENNLSASEIAVTPLEENETLKHAMYSLYENGKFCDVTLRSGTATYSCHKVVLCSRSVVFSTMFESDMLERRNNVVDIVDVNPSILKTFLKYMYTDKVGKLDFEDALQLFSVADKYAVMPLQRKCISILKTKITTENAMEILICSDMHQNDELSKFSKNYICKHAKYFINSENWKTVKKSYPGLALDIQDQLIGKMFL